MYCASCGSMMNDDARFCPHCGMPVSEIAHLESDYAGLTIDVETGRQIGETSVTQEPTRVMYERPVRESVPMSPSVETMAAPLLAQQVGTVLPYEEQPTTVQPQALPTAYEQLSAGKASLTQQAAYEQPYAEYAATSYQARRQSQRSRVPLVAVVAAAFVLMIVGILHFSGVAPWVRHDVGPDDAAVEASEQASELSEEVETPVAEVESVPAQSEDSEQLEVSEEQPTEEEVAPSSEGTYMLPDSATRIYSADEIAGLSDWELFVARNEIYARHGRQFQSQQLQEYFAAQAWYQGSIAPEAFDESVLSDTERANIDLILQLESSRGSTYL